MEENIKIVKHYIEAHTELDGLTVANLNTAINLYETNQTTEEIFKITVYFYLQVNIF